ncbi:hypothetical protein JKA74_05245 [Marivirga sp. S37H4]|uniref:Uncharacterized protein n=1 Tax=Marivirga aurantiaca TaxID=2802615 RepID=A0A934WWL6_9BACT|nr:hypothetical protein [Marivirga aurantiaca]MBK6264434.1 hypothetical protein [Marivirga aurantiaca]
MKVNFINVTDDRIKESFMKVMKRYKPLHDYEITLNQERIKESTMQAQPLINFRNLFTGIKSYQIKLGVYVRDSDTLAIADLPEDVLTGWFAHELGHLVDYEPFSNFKMVFYGLRYYISTSFRKKVEHAADYIAVDYGFHEEIIATKQYILEHDLLEESYKAQIRRYYLSIDDINVCMEKEPLLKPVPEV